MAQHLPIQAKHRCQLKTTHQKAKNNSISAWLSPHAARRNCSRPPGGTSSPPGARDLPASLFYRYCLAEHVLPPGAPLYSALSHKGYRLAVCSGPPGAIPEAVCN
ncbi:hypothetical protein DEO72_LG3g435 [Vigna unguiculata]|uniref:Uncharacterized protein n=1 Tax=Vigna unguiculata TaxID=3917 RepID=A0A4D6LC73_VIGUN|nr:hypothetical protein DEO72_LG3g435 [Vigna unguiculata]